MIKLNNQTGEVLFSKYRLFSELSLSGFEKSVSQSDVKALNRNPPYITYVLNQIDDGFILSVGFVNQKLFHIILTPIDPKYTSWTDFKNEEEYQQHKEECINKCTNLLSNLGGMHPYSWGQVRNLNDDKGGTYQVVLKYN